MKNSELRIAIDGGAGTGKTSISKLLSEKIGVQYISTGLMYRLLTLEFIQAGLVSSDTEDISDFEMLVEVLDSLKNKITYKDGDIVLNGDVIDFEELQSKPVRNNINKITGIKEVRDFCKEEQVRIAKQKGVLLEGRDITSIIMPDADFKFYIEADPRVKAERRVSQLITMGLEADFDEILKGIIERDKSDTDREIAPLIIVDDAIVIKNENMTLEQVVSKIQLIINEYHSNIPLTTKLVKEINDEK